MRLQATSTGRGKSAAFTQVQRPPLFAAYPERSQAVKYEHMGK